jgi:putative membrane protein
MMGFGLLFVIVVVGAVAYAGGWRPQWGQSVEHESRSSAIDIVRERYARGEISKAEYEQIRHDLEA